MRRVRPGQFLNLTAAGAAMNHPISRQWKGYWLKLALRNAPGIHTLSVGASCELMAFREVLGFLQLGVGSFVVALLPESIA